MRCNLGNANRGRPERKRCRNHDQAHGLFQDDRPLGVEIERAYQDRKVELRLPSPMSPPRMPTMPPLKNPPTCFSTLIDPILRRANHS
jgi:hypothetical protein